MNAPPPKKSHCKPIPRFSNISCAIPPINEEASPATIWRVQNNGNKWFPEEGKVFFNSSRYMPDALKAPSATKFKINVDISTKCPWYNSVREVEPAIVEKNENEHFFSAWRMERATTRAGKKAGLKFFVQVGKGVCNEKFTYKVYGYTKISPLMTASKKLQVAKLWLRSFYVQLILVLTDCRSGSLNDTLSKIHQSHLVLFHWHIVRNRSLLSR